MDEQEYEYRQRLEERRKKRLELKRKRQMRQRIVCAVLALVLILVIVLIVKGCGGKDATAENKPLEEMSTKELKARAEELGVDLTGLKEKEDIIAAIEDFIELQNKPDEPVVDTPPPQLDLEEEVTTATLSAVGDIMVYDSQIEDAMQANGTYDFSHCFADVAQYLSASDLTVGNLEANFCGGDYSGYPNFNAPEALATNLADIGFDILQTANTYSIQNGLTGLTSTIKYITDAGMSAVGTYYAESDKEDNAGVLIKEVNGIKFAFIAYTKGVNNMYLPTGSEYCVDVLYKDYYSNYSQVDTNAILESIDAARAAEADVIIAMVHWGSEYDLEPSSSQETIAELMFTNGVDVILGSHTHIVGGMQTRKVTTIDGEEKDVFLAYSLGNFISNMTADYTQDSVILNLEFTKSSDGNTTISKAEYIPVYIADNGEDAEDRYVLLDTYAEIDTYVGGAEDRVSDNTFNALKAQIDALHAHAGAAFDAGAEE